MEWVFLQKNSVLTLYSSDYYLLSVFTTYSRHSSSWQAQMPLVCLIQSKVMANLKFYKHHIGSYKNWKNIYPCMLLSWSSWPYIWNVCSPALLIIFYEQFHLRDWRKICYEGIICKKEKKWIIMCLFKGILHAKYIPLYSYLLKGEGKLYSVLNLLLSYPFIQCYFFHSFFKLWTFPNQKLPSCLLKLYVYKGRKMVYLYILLPILPSRCLCIQSVLFTFSFF